MASWVIGFISSTGYFGIVLLMFIENVFPPIPSELIMPLAGYMVAQGKLTISGVIVAGMAGSVLGALPLYFLGRQLGERRLKDFADKHGRWLTLSRNDIDRSSRWFDRHGRATVLILRLIPGIRSLVSLPAGIARMQLGIFLACTAVGTGIWAALLSYFGYWLGSNFKQVSEYLDPVSWFVFSALAFVYAYRVIRHR